MIILGLTGSVGMGKTTTASFFQQAGIPVYDADATVHKLYHGRAVPLIGALLPNVIIDDHVDRQKLSLEILNNPSLLAEIEKIVHPLAHEEERNFLQQAREKNASIVVLDIPLLLETGGEDRVDKIIVVSAPANIQRERVLARQGMTEEKFQTTLSRQMPDEDKRKRADFIIDTGQGMENAKQQVFDLIQSLKPLN